jgi:transcriptional repressor NrdR
MTSPAPLNLRREVSHGSMPACPHCQGIVGQVLDTRTTEDGSIRRRVCHTCSFRFTTFEVSQARMAKIRQAERLPAVLDDILNTLHLARETLAK